MRQPTAIERYDAWYDSPLGRFCFAAEIALLRRGMGESAPSSILELGCGTGRFLLGLATNASTTVGVDQDCAMLEVARQRTSQNTRFTWMQADAASVPLPGGGFNAVFESTLLCLQRNPKPILDEMVRLCRPGGTVVIGELNPFSPWQLWRRAKARFGIGHFRNAHWHAPRQLMRILEQTGCAPRFVGRAVFCIPINRPDLAILRKATDAAGQRLWPWLGAYYVVAAEKR